MTPEQTNRWIDRLRESAVFYLKMDFALLAAAAALLTLFRLENKEMVKVLSQMSESIDWLLALIAYGLTLERSFVYLPNEFKDEKAARITLWIIKIAFSVQLLLHLYFLGYLGGYFLGWLEVASGAKYL
jgi:hypothetical protein